MIIKNILKLLLTFFIWLSFNYSIHSQVFEEDNQVWLIKYQVGDSLKWALNNYDDKYWSNLFLSEDDLTIETDSIHLWLRARVLLSSDFINRKNYEINSVITGTYEVYWNGVLVGNNFTNKNNAIDEYGILFSQIKIPDSLITAQSNLLSLRITKKKADKLNVELLNIDPHILNNIVKYVIFSWILLIEIIFLILSGYFIKKYRNGHKHIKYLLFSVLSILFSIAALAYIFIIILKLNYLSYLVVQSFELLLLIFLSGILPIYFAYEFNLPYKKIVWFSSVTMIILIFSLIETVDDFHILGSIIISITILIWAAYKKEDSSYLALFGVLSLLILVVYGILDNVLLMGLPLFALFIIIDISKESAYRKIQFIDAQLKSSQLETELYKKFIQPHYILNSLNSVIEWLEEEPAKGVEFITSLSEEFHILSRITDKKLITVEEELKICRAHLKIMSFRKSINYTLNIKDVNEFNTVPPALFHTLIENGITHNNNKNKLSEINFILTEEQLSNGRRYTLVNLNFDNFNSIKLFETEKNSFGIGFKYIKARLNESYGNNWKLVTDKKNNDWETVIEIFE